MPFRKLFLSRWAALLWAAGIVWTAIDTVGFGPAAAVANQSVAAHDTDATDVEVNSTDLAIIANIMKGD